MLAIGCTGGIGAGKSSVVARLALRGAVVVDADVFARDALALGSDGLRAVVAHFGGDLLAADGSLDRAAMAELVFSDDRARGALEAIVHPHVESEIRDALTTYAGSDRVLVVDVALLAEHDGKARYGLDGVLVVDADEQTCLDRLVTLRGMDPRDAKLRMAAQMDRFERLGIADFVLLNIGSLDELEAMVGEAWLWISRLRDELGR